MSPGAAEQCVPAGRARARVCVVTCGMAAFSLLAHEIENWTQTHAPSLLLISTLGGVSILWLSSLALPKLKISGPKKEEAATVSIGLSPPPPSSLSSDLPSHS